jgi:hypothetical protein
LYRVAAASLADYDLPYSAAQSSVAAPFTISYLFTNTSALFRFTNLKLKFSADFLTAYGNNHAYAAASTHSFAIVLYSNGKVKFVYSSISDPRVIPGYITGRSLSVCCVCSFHHFLVYVDSRSWFSGILARGAGSVLHPFGMLCFGLSSYVH